MDSDTFARRFIEAATRARDFAKLYVEEELPDDMRFRVRLNSSYDGNPLRADEVVFPEDGTLERAESVSDLDMDEVVDLLWREGKVPEWIDLGVIDETRSTTIIGARVCGRFTGTEDLLYHEQEGYPPFHVHGPVLPAEYVEGNKFSIHHRSECWTHEDLARAAEYSGKVWSLELWGHRFGDEQIEALPVFQHMEILELHGVPVAGHGFKGLARQPRLRVFRVALASRPLLALEALPPLPQLAYLALEALPERVTGLSSLGEKLPRLTDLVLCSATMPVFGSAMPRFPGLESLSVTLPRLPDGLASCSTNLTTISLHSSQATDEEVIALAALQPNLESLHLRRTPVTDTLLRAAERWTRLRYIDVFGSAVTQDGIERFAKKRPEVRVCPQISRAG